MDTGAGAPPIEFHVVFVPAAGEAAGPPTNPRHQTHETFVPMGTGAGAPPIEFHVVFVPAAGEAAGPPIVPAVIT